MYSVLLQAQGQQPGLGSMIVPFALIFLVMYFFMFRPQQKKMKDQKKFLAALEKGTKVVTIGGLHGTIVEVKTTGRDWGRYDWVPIHYQRQVQWQLYVTGAEECVFAWMLRETAPDKSFVPAWPGPKYVTVKRQQRIIDDCLAVADKLYAARPTA